MDADRLIIQHHCQGQQSLFTMLLRYGEEDITDVQCTGCGRVLRFQALLLSEEEAAREQ